MLSRIDDLPESILDALAWQFHADYYDLAADISMKREHVRSVLKLHQKKGTVWAIREALRLMDIEAEFVHWKETGDKPYTFRLRAVIGGDYYKTRGREALMQNLRRAVDDAKSARSYMTQAEAFLYDSEHQELYAGVKGSIGGNSRILIAHPVTIDTLTLTAGVLPLTGGTVRFRLDTPENAEGNIFAGVVSLSEHGVSISPDLEDIAKLLAKFEERIYLRLGLCEHNIIIPAMDMMRRVQILDDFIHDYSPKTLYPSLKAGALPYVFGWQRIKLGTPETPSPQTLNAGVIPLTAGNITLRYDFPESTSLILKTALTGAYGFDLYLGVSPSELRDIRNFALDKTGIIPSDIYLSSISLIQGSQKLNLDLQPEDFGAGIYTSGLASWEGGQTINLECDDEEQQGKIFAGFNFFTKGEQKVHLHRPSPESLKLFAGLAGAFGLDEYVFIGDDILQELLLQFEQRIFARIDEHEAKEDKAIEELSERLARLERLIEPED